MSPYADPAVRRVYDRERKRRSRALAKGKIPEAAPPVTAARIAAAGAADPVGALAAWSREVLRVPPGHPSSGEPMELPPFAVEFLQAGWNAHESALSTARKNAKSAILAVLALGYLVGPLRVPGWRGAVASLSKGKAAELRGQVAEIAAASGLGVKVRKSPYPGAILSASGSFEVLAADRSAGHASGYDLVCVDETGLLGERSRELLAGLRSSVSAKGGRIVHISVLGDSPLFREVLENPATVAHVYAAPEGCAIDDEAAWAAANPGLGTIKRVSYLRAEVLRVKGAPADEPSFRAYDLNQSLTPSREMICSPDDLRGCFVDELPPREGPCFVGVDAGEATSGTAACAVFPLTGRVDFWLAFGDVPDLRTRGLRDNANYLEMERRGELRTYPGRVVPVPEFLADLAADLEGADVESAASDSWKDNEIRDWRDRAGIAWPWEFRRSGTGKSGSADVRAFQRLVLDKRFRMRKSLALASAISASTLRRDGNGNPAIDRARRRGRIDVLSAAVIAAGMAAPEFDREQNELFAGFL